MTILLSLWTLALGYFVFAHASALKGEVKSVGRIVGLVVMVLALSGVFCSTACKTKAMSYDMGSKWVCPMTGRY